MTEPAGLHYLLAAIGLATIVAGALWSKQEVPRAPRPLPIQRDTELLARTPGDVTYCPGSDCLIRQQAERYCAEWQGTFRAEPDFTCDLGRGIHRIVCEERADGYVCSHLPHSDLGYANQKLGEFTAAHLELQVSACDEHDREIVCSQIADARTGRARAETLVCSWTGCNLHEAPE